MKITFTKMHGCGNDYIYIEGAKYPIPMEDKPAVIRKLSDRHFGIGGDGVIFINPGREAEFEMEMYNLDGSRAEMCGNGIRCVGKYVRDHGLTDKDCITVESCGKVKILKLTMGEKGVASLEVDMGAPILTPAEVPVKGEGAMLVKEPITVGGKVYEMTCVSMGNPHAVVFLPEDTDLENFPLAEIGPLFENHERFPRRTNTEFVKVLDRGHVAMRVWERGSGETLACGTGCCAIGVAGVLEGRTEDEILVDIRGGQVRVRYDREANTVFLDGPAEEVFTGEIEI